MHANNNTPETPGVDYTVLFSCTHYVSFCTHFTLCWDENWTDDTIPIPIYIYIYIVCLRQYITGWPTASSCVLPYANHGAFLAILTNIPLRGGRYITLTELLREHRQLTESAMTEDSAFKCKAVLQKMCTLHSNRWLQRMSDYKGQSPRRNVSCQISMSRLYA